MNYPLTSKFQENRIAICHVLKNPYKNFFVLLGEFPKAHLCIVRNKPKIKDKFISCFKEISLFYLYEHNDDLSLKKLINNLSPYKNIIFLFPSHLDYLKFQRTPLFIQLQLDFYYQMKNFHLRNVSHFPYKWTLFKRTQLTFQFTSLPLMQDKKDLLDKEVPLPSKLSSDELSTDEVASQIF